MWLKKSEIYMLYHDFTIVAGLYIEMLQMDFNS